jgi:hypothetical protein
MSYPPNPPYGQQGYPMQQPGYPSQQGYPQQGYPPQGYPQVGIMKKIKYVKQL